MAPGKSTGAQYDSEEEGPWDDWGPSVQSAFELIKGMDAAEVETASGSGKEGVCADEIDDDDEEEEEKDSDDDWAPQEQGAAAVAKNDADEIQKLLKPVPSVITSMTYETKREADAAGMLLQRFKRPPTIEEARAEIPSDVHEAELIPKPAYRTLTEEEAIVIVNKDASLNIHGDNGHAPLHTAASHALPKLIKAICDGGGEVDMRNNLGETPLLSLASSALPLDDKPVPDWRRIRSIQALLRAGADVHAVNPRGRSVLHIAGMADDTLALETFIEGQADVNQRDLAGFTPLMWAAGRDGAGAVKMLLDKEADMTLKANRGQTALTLAQTNKNSAIIDILEEHLMLLDKEAAKEIMDKEGGDGAAAAAAARIKAPAPEWACKKPPPEVVEGYSGLRVNRTHRPDRRSNVYS
eukprot:NODE_3726_length_1995_cov_8.985011.p1 GENE.NODE_3726_length_1995_cov_8.985011~~NODE_3726_length_1995_cov_8.985011.p1  ORF type:complete len:411 (-),score=153.80 NODE_3726_length_1995_cov_8.985011:694-1926(-)